MHDVAGLEIAALVREQAELLPPRMTTAAFELGRWSFDPTFLTIGSPWSNLTNVAPSSEINNVGGVFPVNIAVTPTFTIVVQIQR
jgi:hypothetical protein